MTVTGNQVSGFVRQKLDQLLARTRRILVQRSKDKHKLYAMHAPGVRLKAIIKRRSAIELTIGHMKSDGKLDRNWLKGQQGDALHAILCNAGHNIRLLLSWLQYFAPICSGLWPVLSVICAQCCVDSRRETIEN